ncbi:hypothetical protein BXY51_007898 [Actinoplanes cyaneus]|nr:hypothetical protein [Actinoplanes cyaneus]
MISPATSASIEAIHAVNPQLRALPFENAMPLGVHLRFHCVEENPREHVKGRNANTHALNPPRCRSGNQGLRATPDQ